ncbi:MAG: hypothetical protein IKV12_03875 [Alistipes sp.]|nr:hypothetical protein [Alistipes sp.]
MKKSLILLFAILFAANANAQKNIPQDIDPLPHKVENLEIRDLRNQPTHMPYWGDKNMLIFYVDPDKHRQNHEFTVEMEENKRAAGPNIEGFGIINLKDTVFPNGIVRALARKRTEKNHAIIITDTDCSVAKQWGLGDCNNMFIIMIVTKEGELVYCKKGELTKEEQEEFYQIVDKYR